MKNVIEHDHSIIQVKSPLPFPLKWVNSYLIKGPAGYTLIDPGLHTKDAKENWIQVLNELNIEFSAIEKIVLTHHHPDHYGLSGWFQEKTSAPVYMSETAHRQAVRLWGKHSIINQEIVTLFIEHGMDNLNTDRMLPHLESFNSLVSPQPDVDYIHPGEFISMGDRNYEMIITNGHAAGQLCFYNKENVEMFCGDQVLPRITPNVSYIPGVDANPLKSFLASLNAISKYSVEKAYPGHRDPFFNFTERIKEIIDHHDERLLAIAELLNTPRSTYEICCSLFGGQLSIHQLRFAMAETLAHVIYLKQEGKLIEKKQGNILNYTINGSPT